MSSKRPQPRLSHVDEKGRARMVDVGAKRVSARRAVAEGTITLARSTLEAITDEKLPKGDVLAAARIAGILAAKKCDEIIPLCHSLPLDSVEVQFNFPELETESIVGGRIDLHIRAIATITAKTGVEMEALTAVSVAALTIYDMCKAIDKEMVIGAIRLIEKTKKPLTKKQLT